MTRADRILAVIDAGLQSSPEPSYGLDSGRCVRCQRVDPYEGSDWCERCRGILLGDRPTPSIEVEEMLTALQAAADYAPGFHEQVTEVFHAFLDRIGKFLEDCEACGLVELAQAYTCIEVLASLGWR